MPLLAIGLLGVVFMSLGFVAGSIRGDRILPDVPSTALIAGGIVVGVFGFFALVSYLGFLFFPPGLFIAGFGIGSAIRRFWYSK